MKQIKLILLLVTLLFSHASAQPELLDSLKQELVKPRADTITARLLMRIGGTYMDLGYLDSANVYLNRTLILSRKAKHKKIEFSAINLLGTTAYYGGDVLNARKYWNDALVIAKRLKHKKMEMDVLQNLANADITEGKYLAALKINLQCLKYAEENKDSATIRQLKVNIGIIYTQQADFDNAMRYFREAERSFPPGTNSRDYQICLTNMAQIFTEMNKIAEAERYYSKALTLAQETGSMEVEVIALGGLADINMRKGNYLEAARQFPKVISMSSGLGDELNAAINRQRLGAVYWNAIENDDKEFIGKMAGGSTQVALQKAKRYVDSAIRVLDANNDMENLKIACFTMSNIEKRLGNCNSALEYYSRYAVLDDTLVTIEMNKKLTQASMQYEFDRKEAATKAEQEKKDVRARLVRNSIAVGLGGALIFLGVVYRQRNKIRAGKKRSDELLLNILPEEVAEELKATGGAEAKQFDQVTVMFTDFKGFTQIAERLAPAELVAEIHTCFKAFDHIIHKYNIEKIKTIGDAYMCAGGLPVANVANAADVVKAALEIRTFMQNHIRERRNTGKEAFEIRIGIHTGPVVAGIVGVKKFAYDIWGDTVNTASRMESSGEPGEINISGSTYEMVKDQFNCTYRGKIAAKNKGEIDMYFVNG